jgi:hypothetical protein
MAFSFEYMAVEPQVEGIISTLHSLGIATSISAGFMDSVLGCQPYTSVSFEIGKISPQTIEKIKKYLESISNNVDVHDGFVGFGYMFPTNKKLSSIDAQKSENARPALDIWSGVEKILKQDLPN